jgi:hypothetical protein
MTESESPQEKGVTSATFLMSHIVVGHAYPATDVCAEIGRVTVAAARVDQCFVRILVAVHHPEQVEALLRWSSKRLVATLHTAIGELFVPPLSSNALAVVDSAYAALERRHAVAHTIWTLPGREAAISVDALSQAMTAEERDVLMRRDVPSENWTTLHPKTQGPGPTLLEELEQVRVGLEDAALTLRNEAFTLASALFAGKPRGAKHVLNPATMKPREA